MAPRSTIAFRAGRRVQWDAANERVVEDAEAQPMIEKPYRAPWKLPTIGAATTPTASR